jgi:hypothetical protein
MRGLVIRVYDSKEEEHEDCSKSDMSRRRYHGGIRCLMNDCGENDNDMDMELGGRSKGSAGPRAPSEDVRGEWGRPDSQGEDEEQEAATFVLIRAFLPGPFDNLVRQRIDTGRRLAFCAPQPYLIRNLQVRARRPFVESVAQHQKRFHLVILM